VIPVDPSAVATWLPNLPRHWERKRLKLLFRLMGGGTPSKDQQEYWIGDTPWVSAKDMKFDLITDTEDHISDDAIRESATNVVPEGTMLIVTRSGILKHTIPVAITGRRVAINQDLKAAIPRRAGLEVRYFAFLIKGFQDQLLTLWRSQGATVESLDTEIMGNTDVPLPPLSEQCAIADYLDREAAKIDVLIGKQEELVTRIEELERVFTEEVLFSRKGIRRPLRESGIIGLGQVPTDWCVIPVGRLFRERDERNQPHLPILQVSIHDGVKLRDFTADKVHQRAEDSATYKVARRGDLVFNKMRFWQGAVGVAPEDGLVSPDYTVAVPNSDVDSRYFAKLFKTPPYLCQIMIRSKGIVLDRNRLYWDDFKGILVACPPFKVQAEILTRLDVELEAVLGLRSAAIRLMNRLSERRSALIAAAVTGLIDVGPLSGVPAMVATNDNRRAFCVAVGVEIVSRQGAVKNFGRVKFQKLLYLAEVHAGIQELAGNYVREAAGPLARELLSEVERGMATGGYFNTVAPTKDGDGYSYSRIGKAGAHKDQYRTLLGDRAQPLNQLIDLLKEFDTRAVEAITTLYAVWNDALIDGETPDDDRLIRGVLDEWHHEKRSKFTPADLTHWLSWMRRNGLVPTGKGARTYSDQLFV
jgi:restriction endonuclease S subunit